MQTRRYELPMTDLTLKPRPTIYNGVQMRSRLEAGFAQWADSMGLGVDYEPHAFAGDAGQYLPDFRLRYVDVEGGAPPPCPYEGVLWVEVKPFLPAGDALVALCERMEIIHESEPLDALAVVYKDPVPGVLLCRYEKRGWRRAAWTCGGYGYHIGVAVLQPPDNQPWPDGYWLGS